MTMPSSQSVQATWRHTTHTTGSLVATWSKQRTGRDRDGMCSVRASLFTPLLYSVFTRKYAVMLRNANGLCACVVVSLCTLCTHKHSTTLRIATAHASRPSPVHICACGPSRALMNMCSAAAECCEPKAPFPRPLAWMASTAIAPARSDMATRDFARSHCLASLNTWRCQDRTGQDRTGQRATAQSTHCASWPVNHLLEKEACRHLAASKLVGLISLIYYRR